MVCPITQGDHNKCFVLHMGRSYDSPLYVINNVALRVTDVANDLGVQVDSKLRFSHHYENVVSKAHQRASLILKCLNVVIQMYYSVHSLLMSGPFWSTGYCSPVWLPSIRLILNG